MPALPLADLFASYRGALALASLLDGVARGGAPGRAVISMSESLDEVQEVLKAEYRLTGVLPSPGQTLFSGKFPCYRLYESADGRRISVGAIEGKFWQEVCRILELPALVGEAYATGDAGAKAVKAVQERLGSLPWSHWAPLFAAADCCVEPVLDYSEL
jgi:crotonobetainyl-CoA:carnitine CoA-transferase CaiB-like acyl-CoA transferase